MFGILADDSDDAFPLNDFALIADRLDRCSNFHLNLSFYPTRVFGSDTRTNKNSFCDFPLTNPYYRPNDYSICLL